MLVRRTAILMAICAAMGVFTLLGPSRTAWSQEPKPPQETAKPQEPAKPKQEPKANPEAKPQQDSTQAQKAITITGCVQKGEADNQYVLTAEGKKYAVTGGSNLALDTHVGKKIAVTGTMGADAPPEGYAGQVTATAVKIVDEKGGCE